MDNIFADYGLLSLAAYRDKNQRGQRTKGVRVI